MNGELGGRVKEPVVACFKYHRYYGKAEGSGKNEKKTGVSMISPARTSN
jgi:hypothetical protein